MREFSRRGVMKAGMVTLTSLGLIGALGSTKSSGQSQASVDIEQRLRNLGMQIPKAPKPVGAYVATRKSGNLLFISGQLPFAEGKLTCRGKVG